jgi:signal peptidase I
MMALMPVALFLCAFETGHIMRASGLHVFDVPSTSMSPTVDAGDKIMVDMRYFRDRKLAPGEVVIFCHHNIFLVKRVIGVGGNTISSKDGHIELDGKPLKEPYVVHRNQETADGLNNFGPVKVAADQLFVVGDNRDDSLDSRWRSGEDDFGPVFVTDVIGKPLYRYSSKISSDHDGQRIQ